MRSLPKITKSGSSKEEKKCVDAENGMSRRKGGERAKDKHLSILRFGERAPRPISNQKKKESF